MLYFLFPFTVLIFTASALLFYHWLKPEARGLWLLALGGVALALGGVFWWGRLLPLHLTFGGKLAFYPATSFWVDKNSWHLALTLMVLLWSSLLTAVLHPPFPAPQRWAGSIILTIGGLLALQAADPQTLIFLWVILDVAELMVILPTLQNAAQNERAVILFSTRLLGVGLLLWADVLSKARNMPLSFETPQNQAAIYILLAAALRLGVLPAHLPMESGSSQRRDLGAILRSAAALSSLILLARIPLDNISGGTFWVLTGLLLVTAGQSALLWLRAKHSLSGRPFWILGLSALAGIQSLAGNRAGVAALGIILAASSGIISLYDVRKVRYSRWLAGLSLLAMSGLPYTLASPLWQAKMPWALSIAVTLIYALLLAGYVRHLMQASILSLDYQPRLVRFAYLAGLFLLAAAMLLAGFVRGSASWQAFSLVQALAALGLSAVTAWALMRWKPFERFGAAAVPSRRGQVFQIAWSFYRQSGRLLHLLVSQFIENEGGLLWVFVLALLMLSYWIR